MSVVSREPRRGQVEHRTAHSRSATGRRRARRRDSYTRSRLEHPEGHRSGCLGPRRGGVAAPALRRRLKLPRRWCSPPRPPRPAALVVAMPRSRARDAGLCCLNMWAYLAAYEMPNDDPEALQRRVRIDYPIAIDRVLGLGVPPTVRLQRRLATAGTVNRFERLLVFCHWIWFAVPHGAVRTSGCATQSGFRRRRCGCTRCSTPARSSTGRSRPRRRGTPPSTGASATATGSGPANDDRVRRAVLGRPLAELMEVLGGNPLAAMPSLHLATSLMAAQLLTETGPVAARSAGPTPCCWRSRSSTWASTTRPI